MRWGAGIRPSFRVLPVTSLYELAGYSLGQGLITIHQDTVSSAVWPAANLAFYVPFPLEQPMRVITTSVQNGTAVAGTLEVGVYAEDARLLATTGAVTQAGVSQPQTIPLGAPILLGRGLFYMALLASSGAATVLKWSGGGFSTDWIGIGVAQEATGGTLPATATFASLTVAYIPYFSLHALTP